MDANGSTMTPGILSSPTMTTAGDGPAARRPRLNVRRTGIVLKPNNSRVVIRPFEPASEQPDRADHRPRHVALGAGGRRPARRRDARVPQPPPEDPRTSSCTASSSSSSYLLTDQHLEREPPDADRLVLHPGVRAGIGGAVQSVDGLAPRPVGPGSRARAGSCSACAPPARDTSRRSPSAAARSTPRTASAWTSRRGS